MDFVRILKSLEELLYEVMTWLLFYPRTFWRVLRNPLAMLRYSDQEQKDTAEEQYTDALSPPMFLMVTILLSHVIEMASHQRLPTPVSGIAQTIYSSEQNLLLLRSILFAVYPLMFAAARLRHEGKPLNRDTLRGPFYAQCYIAAPAALVFGICTILLRSGDFRVVVAGSVIGFASIAWYILVEARWLQSRVHLGRARALGSAFCTWLLASLVNVLASALVLGFGRGFV